MSLLKSIVLPSKNAFQDLDRQRQIALGLYFILLMTSSIGWIYHAENETLHFLTRALLMPILIVYLLTMNQSLGDKFLLEKMRLRSILVTGLFASWVGDICIVLQFSHPHLFLIAITCYLVAHVCVVWAIKSTISCQYTEKVLKKKPWLMLPSIILSVIIMTLCFENMGDVFAPGLVYIVALNLMVYFAINLSGRINMVAFQLILLSAILWILADMFTCLHAFYYPLRGLSAMAVLSYGFAQLCLTLGFAALLQQKAPAQTNTEE